MTVCAFLFCFFVLFAGLGIARVKHAQTREQEPPSAPAVVEDKLMADRLEPLDASHASGVDQADDKVYATGGHLAGCGLLVDSRLLLVGTWWEKRHKCTSKLNFAHIKKVRKQEHFLF